MRDVALVPERDVLEPDERRRPHDAREPADALRDDGVPLVRHRGRALLPAAERLLDLAHLGSGEVADLERELLERRPQRARARSAARRAGRAGGSASTSARARARAARTRFARRPGRSPSTSRPRPRASRRAARRAHARRASRSRSSSNAQPASFSPNVVGSACTPCVRPIVSVSRCSSARRDDRGERAVDAFDDQPARLLDLQRERRVEDVGGREPVVEPAPVLAEPLGDRVDERRDVVVRPLLDLAHALRRRRDRGVPDRLRRLGGHAPDLGPRVERGELDLEPPFELSLLRPDPGHRRTGVAGDHPARLAPTQAGQAVPSLGQRDARDRVVDPLAVDLPAVPLVEAAGSRVLRRDPEDRLVPALGQSASTPASMSASPAPRPWPAGAT